MNLGSNPARSAGLLLAGMMLLFGSPACSGEPAVAKKPSAATRKIVGRTLDADGRPVGGAVVCLERVSDTEDDSSSVTLVAQTESAADGRFQLTALERDLDAKPTADGSALFQLWSWKQGLAIKHLGIFSELCGQPYILMMDAESPLSIRVQKPDGTPCNGATVTPTAARFANWWARIPMPIQKRLKVQSAADGRAELHGSSGRGLIAAIETPEFGVQTLSFAGTAAPETPIKLRTTRVLEGRFIIPQGVNTDLTKFQVAIKVSADALAKPASGRPSQVRWADAIEVRPDAKGRFTIAHLPEGEQRLWGAFADDVPLVPGLSLGGLVGWEFGPDGLQVTIQLRPFVVPGATIKEHRCVATLTLDWRDQFPVFKHFARIAYQLLWPDKFGRVAYPLRKGVFVTRIVRDSQSKKPVPGVWVSMTPARRETINVTARIRSRARLMGLPLGILYSSGQFVLERTIVLASAVAGDDPDVSLTDEKGALSTCLCPGRAYATQCRLPGQYVRCRRGTVTEDRIPPGVDRYELEPIELVRGCTVAGDVLGALGRPLRDVRVLAICRGEVEPGGRTPAEVRRWATTDYVGQFRFERLEAGSTVTLVPVREGLPLADPVVLSLNGDQVVHVRKKKYEYAALAGRILGVDQKPIAGAHVVIEVENSPEPTRTFRTTTDKDGSFHAPARFPQHLKYRVTVRRILQDVASSDWMCPATSGTRFRDLVVDRAKLGLESRIELNEVVARVNGQPILASELLERACAEPLPPHDMSLLAADALVVAGDMTAQEYRALEETAIRKYVGDYIRTRLLTQALEAKTDDDQKTQVEQAVGKMFEEYVEKLKKDLKVTSRVEVDQKLQRQGTSLASLKIEFRYHLLADEFVRRAGKQEGEVDWDQSLAYYNAHRDLYAESEKVAWQLLEIQFDPPLSEQAQTQKNEPVNDWHWGDTQAQRARTVHDVSQQMQVDLGSFDPKPDKAPGSEVSSAHWSAESDKSAEDSQKKPDEIDLVAYASRLSSRAGRQKAHDQIQKALSQIQQGESFDAVVKKYSNGPHADRGGWQSRLNPGSLADQATADALRKLAEGQTTGIIEAGYSFRIVRLVSRTPAGLKPFEEVEDSIKPAIQRQKQLKALADVLSQATIECPYIDDVTSILPTPPCQMPKPREDDAFAQ